MANNGSSSSTSRFMTFVTENRAKSFQFILRFITLICGIAFILSGILVSGLTGYTYYYYAFLSAFFTFAIQLNKRMSENQVSLMSRAFINLVVSEDSGHYTIYCFFFYNQYPSIIHIFPIILHAVLAMARYLQEINQLLPPGIANVVLVFSRYISMNQSAIHRFIAYCEVFTFPIILWQILYGRMFILAPLFYYNFLKMRYTSRRNPSVRLVFSELHQSASYIAAHQNCPSFISSVIYKLDAFITRLNPMTPPQPPPTN